MTIYRSVVNALAFILLLLYGVNTGWELLSRVVDWASSRLRGGNDPLSFPAGHLIWSAGLAAVALLIGAPIIRRLLLFFRRLREESRFDEGLADKLNVVGRWVFASLFLWFITSGAFPFFVILFGLLVAPEMALLFAAGPSAMVDAVFFPGGRETRPPYSLKLARFYTAENRWEEAEAEYARMLGFYPDMAEAWQERLELALRRGAEADPGPEEVLASGLKSLGIAADREALYQTFSRAGGSPGPPAPVMGPSGPVVP